MQNVIHTAVVLPIGWNVSSDPLALKYILESILVTQKCTLFDIRRNFKKMDHFQRGIKEKHLKYFSIFLWSSDYLHFLWKMKGTSENRNSRMTRETLLPL